MTLFSGNSLWHLIAQSDITCKLVLLTLLCMSVLCWAIFFGKLIIFRIKNKQFHHAYKQLSSIKNVSQLTNLATSLHNTAPGYFLMKNLTFVQDMIGSNSDKQLTDKEWELIERNSDIVINTMMVHNESYLPILSTCAAVATLLGLFGTVWGLVHSFMRISETQVADIATIAPGIAEALITTLGGLIIAIPAFIMFNILQTKVRYLEHMIVIFAEKMTLIMQQSKER